MLSKIEIRTFATKMDRYGVLAFAFVILYSMLALKKEMNVMNWILLFVGIGGFLVDSFIVVKAGVKNVS